jgi:hypothetical protein
MFDPRAQPHETPSLSSSVGVSTIESSAVAEIRGLRLTSTSGVAATQLFGLQRIRTCIAGIKINQSIRVLIHSCANVTIGCQNGRVPTHHIEAAEDHLARIVGSKPMNGTTPINVMNELGPITAFNDSVAFQFRAELGEDRPLGFPTTVVLTELMRFDVEGKIAEMIAILDVSVDLAVD